MYPDGGQYMEIIEVEMITTREDVTVDEWFYIDNVKFRTNDILSYNLFLDPLTTNILKCVYLIYKRTHI